MYCLEYLEPHEAVTQCCSSWVDWTDLATSPTMLYHITYPIKSSECLISKLTTQVPGTCYLAYWILCSTGRWVNGTAWVMIAFKRSSILSSWPSCYMQVQLGRASAPQMMSKNRVTTLQTMWNSLTIPWHFPEGSRHSSAALSMLSVTHARTSVTVSGEGGMQQYDPKPYT